MVFKNLRPCALDEISLSIGRVNIQEHPILFNPFTSGVYTWSDTYGNILIVKKNVMRNIEPKVVIHVRLVNTFLNIFQILLS